MTRSISFFLKSMGFIFLFMLLFAYTKKTEVIKVYEELLTLPQEIQSVPIASEYFFAGEKISMDNFDLKERMDRELIVNAYRHSATIQYIKLSTRYFPVIEPILRKNGIPDDFKYLAVAESGLRNVSSPANAKGIWQFMRPIAKDLGLEIYDEVDERYHLEKSTQAACEYLNRLHDRFGSWINAAAAYNAGPTNFSKYLREQDQDHYFDLNISEETMRYLFRIVAIKSIIKDPLSFGYNIPIGDRYHELNNYYTVEVDTSILKLGAFAQENGTSYRMLKIYIPGSGQVNLPLKTIPIGLRFLKPKAQ